VARFDRGVRAGASGCVEKGDRRDEDREVKDNLYIITGSGVEDTEAFSGGNVAVFITDSGVTLVDTKLPGFGPTIVDRVKSVTNKPITRIINTHTHGDHTGGNPFFGGKVETIVQENTKANMAKMDDFKGANASLLPGKTYKDKLTIGAGKDRHRSLLLRPRPYERRHLRGVPRAAHDARGRHIRVEGAVVHRSRQRRQRGGAAEDAGQGGRHGQERGHHHQRPHPGGATL
jgi:glyoxylase-like metal-dependent hydrolase (beta-lactamase superfamily II)